MAFNIVTLVLLILDVAISDTNKRLVLHSDQDINSVVHDLWKEINATKQENLALKTQMAQGIHTLETKMAQENLALKAELEQLKRGQGSTYVRWGRTVCAGNGTVKVYSGFAAGSNYNEEGGAADNICLPKNPSWAQYTDGLQKIGGVVYGTEYETSNVFVQKAFGKNMRDQDAPCVVCHSPRSATIMIPGSTNCSSGWTQEYTGYLMTGHANHLGVTNYACVDKDPEAVYHGEASTNGKLFYFTEVHCGTLPCQEYPEGRELACVVCSN